jgi:NNP family nitrate/nitrite transporter-like MFS transporter
MKIIWFINLAILIAFIKVFEIPSMIPLLVNDLGIDYVQAGTFMTVYTFIRCLASFPAGSLTDKWGAVPVIGICLIVIALTGFVGTLGSSYWLLITSRILVSVGITVIFIAAVDAIPKYLSAEDTGKGIGYINVSLNIGIALSLFMTPVLADLIGWRWTARIYSLSFLLLFLLSIPLLKNMRVTAHGARTDTDFGEEPLSIGQLLMNLPVMLLALASLILFVELYGVLTWVPVYLADVYKYSPGEIGTSATMFGIVAIPASLITGFMCTSLHRITWLCVSGGILAGVGILLLLISAYMPLWLTIATITVITWGHTQVVVCIMSIASLIAPSHSSGKTLGLIFAFGYGGAMIPTYLGGYLLESTGGYQLSFTVFSFSAFLSIIAMLAVCKILRNNPPAHFKLDKQA